VESIKKKIREIKFSNEFTGLMLSCYTQCLRSQSHHVSSLWQQWRWRIIRRHDPNFFL